MSAIAYLSRLCQRWGGELKLLPDPEFWSIFDDPPSPGWSQHPHRDHGIDLRSRKVFARASKVNAGTIIHEMGHVFLKEGNPVKSNEPDWLGWEIALSRRARCYREWSVQNVGYGLDFEGEDREWGALTPDEERRLITDRINFAKALGIVSQDGVPLCTRTPATSSSFP